MSETTEVRLGRRYVIDGLQSEAYAGRVCQVADLSADGLRATVVPLEYGSVKEKSPTLNNDAERIEVHLDQLLDREYECRKLVRHHESESIYDLRVCGGCSRWTWIQYEKSLCLPCRKLASLLTSSMILAKYVREYGHEKDARDD